MRGPAILDSFELAEDPLALCEQCGEPYQEQEIDRALCASCADFADTMEWDA